MKRKVYICPKNCSISDHASRCRRCGEWMLYAGEKTDEEITKFSEQLTKSAL